MSIFKSKLIMRKKQYSKQNWNSDKTSIIEIVRKIIEFQCFEVWTLLFLSALSFLTKVIIAKKWDFLHLNNKNSNNYIANTTIKKYCMYDKILNNIELQKHFKKN